MRFLVAYIGLCVVVYAFAHVFHISFINPNINAVFMLLGLFGIPACILASLIFNIKRSDTGGNIFAKVMGTLGITAIVSYGLLSLFLSITMCDWNGDTEQVLYRSRTAKNITVIQRQYWCLMGAADNEPYVPFVRTTYGNILVRYVKIDLTKLNKQQWLKVK